MIGRDEARAAAADTLSALLAAHDPLFAPWPEPEAGAPVMVEDLSGAPSYWLVPLEAKGRAIGAARVDERGHVMTIGLICRTPDRIEACPRVVTLLTAEEAEAAARSVLGPGETASPPRFVHDGPPGREAWLIETSRDARPARWITVTPGGATARPAGQRIGDDPGLE
ncbi:hypothetical protein [Elioraea rosea]|uniref:hypothetical protein n=1 Tax=Elioraea rosea TaxID=2492390 RepID=UPI001185E49F|nr:hypothetical protein [Elioraea rosea]